jgi:hypothetical protein
MVNLLQCCTGRKFPGIEPGFLYTDPGADFNIRSDILIELNLPETRL